MGNMSMIRQIAAAAIALLASLANGETITVCASGCDYTSLQAAIDAAPANATIQLAEEIYEVPETITFTGKPLTLVGTIDDTGLPASILDGLFTSNMLAITLTHDVVVRDIEFRNGAGGVYVGEDAVSPTIPLATFDNCTFRDSLGDGLSTGVTQQLAIRVERCRFLDNRGIGLDSNRPVTSISECRFARNGEGGADIFFYDEPTNYVRDSAFIDHGHEGGIGAIRVYASASADKQIFVENCLFEGNRHVGDGGGAIEINSFVGADLRIVNCAFRDNQADFGGAIRWETLYPIRSELALEGCSFEGNVATTAGGAIYGDWGGITILDTTLRDNAGPVGSAIMIVTPTFDWEDERDQYPLQIGGSIICGHDGLPIDTPWRNLGGNVLARSSEDLDQNGLPDECEGADLNRDGILDVPAEYSSVLSAVAAAPPGGQVRIAAGVHTLPFAIDVDGREITIRGEVDANGRPATVLDAEDRQRVLRVVGETSVARLENIVLRHGRSRATTESSDDYRLRGGNAIIWEGTLRATNCDFTDGNDLSSGSAFEARYSAIELESCRIQRNAGFATIQAIYMRIFHATGCEFTDNTAGCVPVLVASHASWAQIDLFASFDYCTFARNEGNEAGFCNWSGALNLYNYGTVPITINRCTITDNTGNIGGLQVRLTDPSMVEVSASSICGNASYQTSGAFTDLGGNQIGEACETDCNFNGVVDTIDIIDGTSTDCDGDGQPDECQFVARRSGRVDRVPTSIKDAIEFDLSDVAAAFADVTLEITANGDLGAPAEFLVLYLDDQQLGVVFLADGQACTPVADAISIPASLWNTAGADGVRTLRIGGVNVEPGSCDDEYVAIQVTVPVVYTDCDGNGIWDICDIEEGGAPDLDGNGLPDVCDADCDGDGEPDAFEIASGQSFDCNGNFVPDGCDIDDGGSADVDGDGVPDECQDDCDGDGLPDAWEIQTGTALDCNQNLLPDDCDVASGASNDVDANGIPDECKDDCNGNGLPDYWEILQGSVEDCDANGVPDACDIAGGLLPDCDLDGVPDECAILDEVVPDCNDNGIPDSCDIAGSANEDDNENGIPDACELVEGDLNLDGCIDAADLGLLFVVWSFVDPPFGDLDGNGVVGAGDLGRLLTAWRPCP